jgi:hypothetical protein
MVTTTEPPLLPQIPILPPPSSYPEVSYAEQWKTANEAIGKTVFGLVWLEDFLVGCTSSGSVLVWRIPNLEQEEEFNAHTLVDSKRQKTHNCEDGPYMHGSIRDNRKPIARFVASTGVLYSIGFIHRHASLLLGTCGDEGVKLFSWSAIESLIDDPAAEVTPLSQYRPHTSHTVVEVNDFTSDENFFLYGASGDGFGCYKWDIESEKLIKTYESPKRGYLHSVEVLPSSTNPGGHSVLLMGGEDGVLGIWDRKQDQLIENIDIKLAMNSNSSLVTSSLNRSGSTKWSDSANLWVSHVHSSPETSSWWNVCGGADNTSTAMGEPGGYVTSWHAPTRSLAAGCTTRESPNRMSCHESSLATVANEAVVSYWSSTRAERTGRFWCTPPCAYAIAVRESDGLTAVGGVGNTVDIFENQGTKLFSLTIA